MKMSSKYRDIRTLDQLDEAIHRNTMRIGAKSEAVGRYFARVQDYYTPQSLVTQGVRKAALSVNFYGTALSVIRFLKRRLK